LKKKWVYTIVASVVSVGIATKIVFAAGLVQIQVNIVPFNWSLNDKSYTSEDSYNNGKERLPTSLNYKGTTYIPIRMVAESIGYKITWDDATKTAMIDNSPSPEDPVEDLPPIENPTPVTKYYPQPASVTVFGPLLKDPSSGAKVLRNMQKAAVVHITEETNKDWLQVVADDGQIGYLPRASTDYVYKADRPAWEKKVDAVIAEGLKYLGAPYQFGASTKQTETFDCSSFMKLIFGRNDVTLPRDSRQQSQQGDNVSLDQLRKGDLLFFTTSARKNLKGLDHIGHVAIYLGENKVLQTYKVGIGVTVTNLDANWTSRIVSAKRIVK
jgi:cell wall-associated NlpC family hydrolase